MIEDSPKKKCKIDIEKNVFLNERFLQDLNVSNQLMKIVYKI